jgi:hypothetical protein
MSRPNPWAGVTGAMEAELTPILDLVIEIGRGAGLTVPQQATWAASRKLRSGLSELVVAARCHSAGPILPGWATLQETGERLGIPYRTVYRWATTGHGPGGIPIRAEYHGKTWFVNIDDARKAAQPHGHEAEPDPRAAARSRRRGH